MRPSTDYTQLHAQDIKGEGPPKSSDPQQHSDDLRGIPKSAKLEVFDLTIRFFHHEKR